MHFYDAGEINGAGGQRGTPPGVPEIRFLSCTMRKKSRTWQTENRKAQALLKQKYVLKEKKADNSEREFVNQLSELRLLFSLGWRHAGNIIMILLFAKAEQRTRERLWSLTGKGSGDQRPSVLLSSLTWSLRLEIKTGRGLSKEQGKNSRALSWRQETSLG